MKCDRKMMGIYRREWERLMLKCGILCLAHGFVHKVDYAPVLLEHGKG